MNGKKYTLFSVVFCQWLDAGVKFDIGATTSTTLHKQENISLFILKQNKLFERGSALSQWACIQQCWYNDVYTPHVEVV